MNFLCSWVLKSTTFQKPYAITNTVFVKGTTPIKYFYLAMFFLFSGILHFSSSGNTYATIYPHIFDELFPLIKQEVNFLKENFIAEKSKKTLYLVNERVIFPEFEQLVRVRDALISLRGENKEFLILYITTNQRFEDFENILVRVCEENTAFKIDKHLPNKGWNAILDQFKFTPTIWD